MKSSFGHNIKVSIWGGSHEPSIGTEITGLPLGTEINMTELAAFLKRRAPGNSPFATKRKEADIPIPIGGLAKIATDAKVTPMAERPANLTNPANTADPADAANTVDLAHTMNPADTAQTASMEATANSADTEDTAAPSLVRTTNAAISFEIKNTDTRSSDYKSLRHIPRPGHADYTARLRYGDSLNMAGGGPFSARMTAPLCIAGGIALQLLKKQGIEIGCHIYSIYGIKDTPFDPLGISTELLDSLKKKDMAVISRHAEKQMAEAILAARKDLDSVGGVVEACAVGLPAGIGGAMYDGLESYLAPIFFGIPAVKGIEFGAGFHAAELKGSENNDAFYYENDVVKTRSNNHGGILGGITTGMPLITRIAFKPTPSISKPQDSVDLLKKENAKLVVKGRHDPCVAVRAVPIVEAALALGILDCLMEVQR